MTNDLSSSEIEYITNEALEYISGNSNKFPPNVDNLFDHYLNADIDSFEFGSSTMVLAFHLPTLCEFTDEQIVDYEGIDRDSINDQTRINFVRNYINSLKDDFNYAVLNVDMYKLSNKNYSCFLCGLFTPAPGGLVREGEVSIFSSPNQYYQFLLENSYYIFSSDVLDWKETDPLITDDMILSYWKR